MPAVWIALVLLAALRTPPDPPHTPAPESLPLRERVLIAAKIYHQVSTFFPELSQKQFDEDYGGYLDEILGDSVDRRKFDLSSMALLATLHDGHTWFYDDWIARTHGQPVGFVAYPVDGRWTIVHSDIDAVAVGDVIDEIDGAPVQQVFERSRKYISGSSDRDAQLSFFDTPVVFPERFTVTLDGGRRVAVDRRKDRKREAPTATEGRWLVEGQVGYVRIPTFHGIETQVEALDLFKKFHEAAAIVLDVRGNPGTGDPGILQRALMDKPYPMWEDHSAMHGGFLLRSYSLAYPETPRLTVKDATILPRDPPVYAGRLLLLTDRGCSCACEDFVMPFKVTRRARLVGEATAGSFSFTNSTRFENGMRLNIAAVRHTFPDGSRFEGVGIAPDVEAHATAADLKAGKDVVLERALAIAREH